MLDIRALIKSRSSETYDLHRHYLNHQFVRVLEVIGFNRNYVSGKGAYLTTDKGEQVLDFLSGFGVFAVGRNHPVVQQVLHDMLNSDLPNLIKMDVGVIAGLLAEALAKIAPEGLDAVFFDNSGAEGVDGALKFARAATGRQKFVYCKRGFHGQLIGTLGVNGGAEYRERYQPFIPGCIEIPFNDITALETALVGRDVAGFIVEPIQGKGVMVPDDDFFPAARRLCDATGTLLIADEVQTGLGRTGKMFAIEHWNVTPDILIISKALSGGFIPVGAIITRRDIYNKVFDSMDHCWAHSTTFGQNDLAMAAGLAALHVLREEKLIENSASTGEYLLTGLRKLTDRFEMLHEVRGKGLMIGLQFGAPKSFGLKAQWHAIHKLNEDLFGQMVTMPLLDKHHILTQVAGHGLDTVKILPPLIIGQKEADMFISAVESVLTDIHKLTGSAWSTAAKLAVRTASTA
jgi:ornithine--oxo-acid transaminase